MESKICRVCLDRTATISLFDKQENMQYREKIMKCVSVSIEEGDGLPDAICESCAAELAVSYEFANKCVASDRALRCLGLLSDGGVPSDLKEEHLKSEIKLEPISQYSMPEPEYDNDERDYDYLEYHTFSKTDINIDICQRGAKIKKTKTTNSSKHKKRQPNHLRKIRQRVYTGPIQCMTCGLVLKCQSAFEQHKRTHTREKPFTCDLCKKCFRVKHSLKCHIYRHYGINAKEQRKQHPLPPDWDGKKHKKASMPIQCVLCGWLANSRSALECHMRTHTGEKPFTCEECNKSYTVKGGLARHIQSCHLKIKPAKFICEHCGGKFSTRTGIIVHLRIHTGEKPYSCPYCPHKTAQISSMIRHKRKHNNEKPFACQICWKAFGDSSLLKKHQSVHSDDKNFVCHICSKAVKTKQSLKTHMDAHNNGSRFVCNFCGMALTTKGNLTMHVSRIHSEKSGICTICDKPFSNLQVHMRVHNGEKPFVCKLCDQGFMTQRSLSHHIGFKHRDVAKFKCSTGQCDKAFPTIAMLEFHVLKAHLDSTPYVCPHCARGFLRPSDLSRHLKTNHMDNTLIKSQFIKTVQITNTL